MSDADKIRDITQRFRQREYKNAPPDAVQKVNEWRIKFADTGAYRINEKGHLCYHYTQNGKASEVTICNFSAHMTREILEDDGFERRLLFEIEGIIDGHHQLPTARVPATQFPSMSWVIEQWGARANIAPVRSAKERLRHALQMTSQYVPQEVIYTHTGWREIKGKWAYLHGGGAIGAENVSVNLGQGMERYTLPPVTDEVAAATASLKVLEVAEPTVTYPLLELWD